jgi:hypothetical protein
MVRFQAEEMYKNNIFLFHFCGRRSKDYVMILMGYKINYFWHDRCILEN